MSKETRGVTPKGLIIVLVPMAFILIVLAFNLRDDQVPAFVVICVGAVVGIVSQWRKIKRRSDTASN
jgi:hypothetical protein